MMKLPLALSGIFLFMRMRNLNIESGLNYDFKGDVYRFMEVLTENGLIDLHSKGIAKSIVDIELVSQTR